MESFQQLSYQERRIIYTGICQQKSKTEIAKSIGRSVSTVTREIKRNSDSIGYLWAGEAHQVALKRRHINRPKIDRYPELQKFIEEKLRLRWSPDIIAAQWSMEHPEQSICKETIYQWLYSSNDNDRVQLRRLLVRSRKKRGLKIKTNKSKIKDRISIHDRPNYINGRIEAGHYECDLMFSSGSASKNMCTLIERISRKCIIIRNDDKSTKTVIDAIIDHITTEKLIVKSITFDNGTEFASHVRFNGLGIKTYFCDPGKPYQKGAIEHLNGMIRRYLPFELDANTITNEYIAKVNNMMNTMPRRILGYKTPLQIFDELCNVTKNNCESRVKLAMPATEAVLFYEKNSCVAFHS